MCPRGMDSARFICRCCKICNTASFVCRYGRMSLIPLCPLLSMTCLVGTNYEVLYILSGACLCKTHRHNDMEWGVAKRLPSYSEWDSNSTALLKQFWLRSFWVKLRWTGFSTIQQKSHHDYRKSDKHLKHEYFWYVAKSKHDNKWFLKTYLRNIFDNLFFTKCKYYKQYCKYILFYLTFIFFNYFFLNVKIGFNTIHQKSLWKNKTKKHTL